MNKSTVIIGIIVLVVLVAGIALSRQSKPSPVNTAPAAVKVVPTAIVKATAAPTIILPSPTPAKSALQIKAKQDFIAACTAKLGSGTDSVCGCAADYLEANYTDADMAKMYIQYHVQNTVPEAVKTAIGKCR